MCGIRISYRIDLDQQEASFEYVGDPDNGKWLPSEEDELAASITLDPELLSPREGFFSPFQSSWQLFEDWEAFQLDQQVRLSIERTGWPAVIRLRTHFERAQWALFDREAEGSFHQSPDSDEKRERFFVLCDIIAGLLNCMTFENADRVERAASRLGEAQNANQPLLREFITALNDGGQLPQLWRETAQLHDEFVVAQPALAPVLAVQSWKSIPSTLADYSMPARAFEQLRHLYVSAFEILARLSVLAIGVEAIVAHNELQLPTKKGKLAVLPDFASKVSKNKIDHIKKYPEIASIAAAMDPVLRNGIGHAQSHYDGVNDEVVCVDGRKGAVTEVLRLSYTDFCRDLMSLMSEVAAAQTYLFMMLAVVGGEVANLPAIVPRPLIENGIKTSTEYTAR